LCLAEKGAVFFQRPASTGGIAPDDDEDDADPDDEDDEDDVPDVTFVHVTGSSSVVAMNPVAVADHVPT
jgi:hypothetical protein